MDQLVQDAVWARLDPLAGRLARRTVRRLRLSATLALLAALATAVAWQSGLVTPRLGWDTSSGWGASASPAGITVDLVIRNSGWTAAEIAGAGRSGPGLRLAAVTGTIPVTLAPGQATTLRLSYRLTDCAAVTASAWPVPVRVRRPWGIVTVYVPVPRMDRPGVPAGLRSFSGTDPYAVQWQRALADRACAAGHQLRSQ